MKRTLLQAAYLLVATCLLLIGVEAALRYVNYTPVGMLLPRFHKDIPGDLEPGVAVREIVNQRLSYAISSDDRGFRSNGPASPRQAGGARILCLGDSYTFGYGVDDIHTFPAQLAAMLSAARPDLAVDVMNAGFPRYGIDEAASLLERKGAMIKPDLVILQFFLNDLQDMARQKAFGAFLLENAHPARRSALERAASRTELYRFALKLNMARGSRNPAYASEQERQVLQQGSPLRDTLTGEQRQLLSSYEGIIADDSARVLEPLWREYAEKVLALREAVERSGGRFLFMIVPDAHQTVDYRLAASSSLTPFLTSRGVDVLDLTFDFMFQTFAGSSPLFLQDDPHCSPAGNALIARRIADGLSFSQGHPFWAARQMPTRDYAARQRAPLRFDARGNTLRPSPPGTARVESLQENLAFTKDQELGLTSLSQADASKPGILELRIAAGAAAFLDARFNYRLPTAESSISLHISEDGRTFVPLKELCARRGGIHDNAETVSILQAPLTPCPGQLVHLRVVLRGAASLVTDTPEGKAAPRPLELFLYPPLGGTQPQLAASLAPFPHPVPGDLFAMNTLAPTVAVRGLMDIERDAAGAWRWATGPETEITFHLDSAQATGMDLRFTNIIEGQSVSILANGKELAVMKGLARQEWLRGTSTAMVSFPGVPGENKVVIRFGKWNGNGADVSQTDTTPYAAAITGLVIRDLPLAP